MVITGEHLRLGACGLERRQTVKALRTALNTVRVVASRVAQKQWQLRSQMHRCLRVGGGADSETVLKAVSYTPLTLRRTYPY